MKSRHRKGLALAAVAVLGLAACSTGETDTPEPTTDATVITVAYDQEFGAYNNNTGANNHIKNQIILNQVLPSLWDFDSDGEIRKLDDFGSYNKTSDEPLTVVYNIKDAAVWSDGDPLDCDDFVLQWAAMSNKFPDAGFEPSSTAGLEDAKQPECAEGDKQITVVYDRPYADWIASFGGTTTAFMPAHVLERETGIASIVDAVTNDDAAAMAKAADFWNNAWTFKPGELKPEITPSTGPYMLDSWTAGESLTLKANPNWWGAPPKSNTIVIRFIKQSEQAQALENGDVMVAKPQANPDVLNDLAKAGDGIQVLKGDEYTFEQITFNFQGQFADPNLRKAFALCMPRDEIVEKLIQPINPEAHPLQSRFVFPFQPGYEQVAAAVTDGSFDRANLDQARQLMNGRTGVTVRFGTISDNKRRADTIDLIKTSCDQVGFNVENTSNATFFDEGGGLDSGDFDVALYGWTGSPMVSDSYSIYSATGTQNKGKYSNPQVDQWLSQLNQTTDGDLQRNLVTQVDKQLWDDLATIPLFAVPSVVAHSSTVDGVQFQPAQSDFSWNMEQWSVAE